MKPFVSILIPALNEEKNIKKCLISTLSQDYPSERFEIIVMDNGSTDTTREIAESFGVRVIDAQDLRIGGVRNIGAKYSKGEILAYLDADCVADPDWLINGITLLLASQSIGAVGGPCHVPDQSTWVQQAWGWKHKDLGTSAVDALSTGSFFIRRDVFDNVGGFNDKIVAGEDTEISKKIKNTEKTLILSSSIAVVHMGYPVSLLDFIKRQVWQSRDYIKTKKNKKDPVFILVHLFAISIALGGVLTIFAKNRYSFGLCLGGSIVLPAALAFYRHIKLRRGCNLTILIQSFFLNFLYLLGRSIGLMISYVNTLARFLRLV
ncbi:cellulose synthase/poly-beta-1,6-N-acetylglucosamine synthase-like glycosyltransferase [Marinobacter pelagius]|uniref:Cellulose synthase/poly-beta-1,6-N-acetylglucosamine synthase-like glycosyltransferase n=1 Tax=Marinobacter pelagius TaxID=379482 RepID=A0A366GFF4_9GAMM|nr:glycosyltransferase [Marinobacter pelagius]RBP25689.1 cellulose synthase/poly-beta-1,6-N-acetylglucosamine synthase-like glycosyltransferase [Marinobacter pelagius]